MGRPPAAGERRFAPPIPQLDQVADTVKKAFFIGLGASVLSAEKLAAMTQELSQDLVQHGWLPRKDIAPFVEELKSRAAALTPQLREASEQALTRVADSLGLVRKADLEALKAELLGAAPQVRSPRPERPTPVGNRKRPAVQAKKRATKGGAAGRIAKGHRKSPPR